MRLPRGWIRTDDLQWRRKVKTRVYDLIEVREEPDSYTVAFDRIDLDEFTEEEIYRYISGYYDSVEEIKTQYGKDANGIIAECIFEQMTGVEIGSCFGPYENEDEAEEKALEVIKSL